MISDYSQSGGKYPTFSSLLVELKSYPSLNQTILDKHNVSKTAFVEKRQQMNNTLRTPDNMRKINVKKRRHKVKLLTSKI